VSAELRAIELAGTIDEHRRLHLKSDVPIIGPREVRVTILVGASPDPDSEARVPKIGESEWLRSAAANPAFAFLHDPREDIYSPTDGRPFSDGG
jgi:hypothetical protein